MPEFTPPSPAPGQGGCPRPRWMVPAALLSLTLLSACQNVFEQPERRPCPPVRLEATTSEMTQFRDGPGRDLTDVVLTAEITGYRGACQYDDEEGLIEVTLQPRFAAALGPAAQSRQQSLDYYVAIPRFIPDPAGKQVFTAALPFPDNIDRVRYVGEDIVLTIPLGQGDSALAYPIYMGFQLSPAQIDYNRAQGLGRSAR